MTDEAAGDGAASKTKSKLPLIALVGVVVLAGAGVGAAWALGLFAAAAPSAQGGAAAADGAAASEQAAGGDDGGAGAPAGDPIFVDLPQLLVNLVSDDGGTRFLKLSLAVEVTDERTAERIDQLAPRIVDSFQLYLRTLTAAELRGPGSMFRLKEDLHVRIHRAIAPAEVRDVLFKEMLVQ
ncbi:MAG: flagellar basal body protein FliL [Alphaproteobacteria bacterium]|jgi:flagellar FliL protein|nr:flagellar basal body protein FliL [Alphaproteobacteria bacterium]